MPKKKGRFVRYFGITLGISFVLPDFHIKIEKASYLVSLLNLCERAKEKKNGGRRGKGIKHAKWGNSQ